MYTSKKSLIIVIQTVLDLTLIVTSFIAAYFIKNYILPQNYRGLTLEPNYYSILLMSLISMYLTFNFFDLYSSIGEKKYSHVFLDMLKAVSAGMFLLFSGLYIFNLKDISRILLGVFYFNMVILFSLSKGIIYVIFKRYERNVHNIKNILIIGSRQRARQTIDLIHNSGSNIRIIGCIEIEKSKVNIEVKNGVRVLGTMEDLKDIVLKGVVDEVVFAMALSQIENVDKYMLLIEEIGIHVRIIPEWHIHALLYKPKFAKILFDNFFGTPTVVVSPTSSRHRDLFIKSMIDYGMAGVFTFFSLPLFFMVGVAIKCFSPGGAVFFKQERLGRNGRKFYLYKFRTMVPNAEALLEKLKHLNEADGPAFKIEKDPRIIPVVGRFLRKTSLDEIPQLLNVLRGEMSLVGPRPPLPAEVEQYDIWQRRRLSMKPGLTCLWQVSDNRNDIGFRKWMEMDLEYIDQWSLKLDLLIALRTLKVVIAGHGR